MNTSMLQVLDDDSLRRIVLGSQIPMGGLTGKFSLLTPFCGDRWNEDWEWHIGILNRLSHAELLELIEVL